MKRLEGKVALVTGAGRGIGRSVALKLAREGARLVVNDLDPDPVNAVIEEIRQLGGKAVACCGSVASLDFAQRFVQIAVDTYDGLDIIVNNAGFIWPDQIQKMNDEQWDTIIDCHLTAPFRILRAAQPVLRAFHRAESQAGCEVFRKVVNISSVAGLGGCSGHVNYATAKAGIVGMTKTLAKEWGHMKVNVNCVAFGLIDTRLTVVTAGEEARVEIEGHDIRVGIKADLMESYRKEIPLGRAGTADEAAGAVFLFCIPESDYISGQAIVCGGGMSI